MELRQIIERAKRAHFLVMTFENFRISDIYICSRSSRLVYPFYPYTPETPLKIILKIYSILEISGNFNVCDSSRFQCYSTRNVQNKMAEGFLENKIFRNAHTDTRAQQ